MFSRATLTSICALGLAHVAPAQATQLIINAQGSVTDLHDSSFKAISGAFSQGDAYSLAITADLDAASLWFYSNDKATAFYNLPVSYALNVGSFAFSGSSSQTISITNDTNCSGYCTAADSAFLLDLGFSKVNGIPAFDLGTGVYYQSLNVQFFDITGTTFNGTGLNQLSNIGSFKNPTFDYQLTQVNDPSSAAFASFSNLKYSAQLTSALPEPAAWTMMIFGMGAVGYVMRRRAPTLS